MRSFYYFPGAVCYQKITNQPYTVHTVTPRCLLFTATGKMRTADLRTRPGIDCAGIGSPGSAIGQMLLLTLTLILTLTLTVTLTLGPVAPISVNFNHQLTQHHRHDNSNSRATSTNSSSVKWVSQLTVQLTELCATGP